MTNLTDYIEINHHLMTVKEMSEETGRAPDTIRGIMRQNGWEVYSPVDRTREYIQAHPGAILEDIAEHLDIQVNYTRTIAKEMGIELTTRFQVEGKKEKPEKKQETRYSLMHRAFNDTEPVSPERKRKVLQKAKHVKEAYNQSGSPFGLADKVKDIKLK